MNTKFKIFSAAFMALAMTAGFAAGCTKTPDNTENTSATTSAASTESAECVLCEIYVMRRTFPGRQTDRCKYR